MLHVLAALPFPRGILQLQNLFLVCLEILDSSTGLLFLLLVQHGEVLA